MSKAFIKNYTLAELEDFFRSISDQVYRARQLFSWIYEKNVESFDEVTNYSKDLRAKLSESFILSPLTLEDHIESPTDGTVKYLFRTHDGEYIESVFLKSDNTDEGRLTICISSQVGCPMGCTFCATSKIGFRRNLEVAEILDQINQVRRHSGLKNNNIVFMGMGEPFMNYDNVIKAADIMNYTFGFHISTRKITISTCGLFPQIERYIDEEQPYNLAISLNDSDPVKRAKHMPVENKYPIAKVADMLNRKFPVSRNRLTLEYVMRKDNIGKIDAQTIKKLFKFTKIKLNLIPLNPGALDVDLPTQEEIDNFIEHLNIMNVPISIRKSLGQDINGACGQLSGMKYKELKSIS